MPKVTVLTTIRNGSAMLPGLLANVLGDTFRDLELLIVDDHSTDDTPTILSSAMDKDPRVRVTQPPVPGRGSALRAGVALAESPYIAILDVDDRNLPWRLQRSVSFLDDMPGVSLVGSRPILVWCEDELERLPRAFAAEPLQPAFSNCTAGLRRRNPLCHSSVMYRRDLVEGAGSYDPTLRSQYDYELYVRLASSGHPIYRSELPFVVRLLHEQQTFEARRATGYRLRSIRVQYRALRALPGQRRDWLSPPLRLAALGVPRRTRMSLTQLPLSEHLPVAKK